MKRAVLFLIAACSIALTDLSAGAFVDNQYMTSPQYLQNTGYSTEVSRMIEVVNQDPYRERYQEPKNVQTILKRCLNYIAPGTYTDLDFYNHNGSYNNPSWKDL